jgi:hypothetical protein
LEKNNITNPDGKMKLGIFPIRWKDSAEENLTTNGVNKWKTKTADSMD